MKMVFNTIKIQAKMIAYYFRRAANSFLVTILPKVLYDLIPDSAKDINAIIQSFAPKIDDFFFVQIGANEGVRGDPIHRYIIKYRWSGILVEPVKYYYDKLVNNYEARKGLFFENVAVSDKSGFLPFFYIKVNSKNGNIPSGLGGIGSFDKNYLLSYSWAFPDIKNYLVTEEVQTVTFEDLMRKYNIKKVDLLCLDVEGHEYIILKSINLKKYSPSMIIYEHRHLGENRKECMEFLRHSGYSLIVKDFDTLAFKRPERI